MENLTMKVQCLTASDDMPIQEKVSSPNWTKCPIEKAMCERTERSKMKDKYMTGLCQELSKPSSFLMIFMKVHPSNRDDLCPLSQEAIRHL
jgi:hypothetical protein